MNISKVCIYKYINICIYMYTDCITSKGCHMLPKGCQWTILRVKMAPLERCWYMYISLLILVLIGLHRLYDLNLSVVHLNLSVVHLNLSVVHTSIKTCFYFWCIRSHFGRATDHRMCYILRCPNRSDINLPRIQWDFMGVSKNRGTPKWMAYNGKPYQNGWFGGTTIFGNTLIAVLMEHNPTPPKVYIKPDLRRHGNVTISIVHVAIKTVSYRVAYPSYIVVVMPITYIKLTQGTIEVNMLHTRKKTHTSSLPCSAYVDTVYCIGLPKAMRMCFCLFSHVLQCNVGNKTISMYLAIAIYTLPYCLTSGCEVKLGHVIKYLPQTCPIPSEGKMVEMYHTLVCPPSQE